MNNFGEIVLPCLTLFLDVLFFCIFLCSFMGAVFPFRHNVILSCAFLSYNKQRLTNALTELNKHVVLRNGITKRTKGYKEELYKEKLVEWFCRKEIMAKRDFFLSFSLSLSLSLSLFLSVCLSLSLQPDNVYFQY